MDLSHSGAAIVLPSDKRLRSRRRYRAILDDHTAIIEVANMTVLEEGQLRIGVSFKSLGLELQELVADVLERAQQRSSRLDRTSTVPESIAHVGDPQSRGAVGLSSQVPLAD